jgi:hypothetical protein
MNMIRANVHGTKRPTTNLAVLRDDRQHDAPSFLRKHLGPRRHRPQLLVLANDISGEKRRAVPVVFRIDASASIPVKPGPIARPSQQVRKRPSHPESYQSPTRQQARIDKVPPNHLRPPAAPLPSEPDAPARVNRHGAPTPPPPPGGNPVCLRPYRPNPSKLGDASPPLPRLRVGL